MGKWSGDFPPPGAGDGRVHMPPPKAGCLRVVVPIVAVILGLAWLLLR